MFGDPVEPSWHAYAVGYQRAVQRLVESVHAQEGNDTLVYPIVWLSRHAVEVALKGLIVAFNDNLDESTTFKANHDLLPQWTTVEGLLRTLGSDDEAGLARLRDSIGRISGLDPDGMRFRYPTLKDGTPTTAMDAINLDVLAEEVGGILDALEAALMWVEEKGTERAHEAAAEWWFGLTDEEREEHQRQEEELYRLWEDRYA